jgi:hypothetical protein
MTTVHVVVDKVARAHPQRVLVDLNVRGLIALVYLLLRIIGGLRGLLLINLRCIAYRG